MISISSLARVGRWAIAAATFALAGCIAPHAYVSNMTKEVPASQFHKPDPVHPVQVLFEFQTKGTANVRATEAFKKNVMDQVAASGLFDKVSEEPAAGGALLSIKVNNVPLTDDAAAKGFATGLTFGLKGSTVTDGYEATATYVSATGAPVITTSAKHAIHTTIGNSDAPANATPADSLQGAATMMLHQVVSQLLNELSHQPEFK